MEDRGPDLVRDRLTAERVLRSPEEAVVPEPLGMAMVDGGQRHEDVLGDQRRLSAVLLSRLSHPDRAGRSLPPLRDQRRQSVARPARVGPDEVEVGSCAARAFML